MAQLAIYIRTSTDMQATGLEAQLMACRDYCARAGISDYLTYSDEDESGGKESRPQFDKMLLGVNNGQIDRILVYCLSRLSRGAIQCLMLAAEFQAKGVALLSCSETIDFQTPEGRLLYGILSCVNQYQREDIVRKVKNGLENAKRKGVRLGRRRERDDEAILALIDRGLSYARTARELGISTASVARAVKARAVSQSLISEDTPCQKQ